MSLAASNWVSRLDLKPSSAKFVLFCFADCSNETGISFPSIDHIVAFTSQDRKTVIANIATLVTLGYLQDTGKRRGRTGQIKVYALKNPKSGTVKESQDRNPSTVPNSESFEAGDSASANETGAKIAQDDASVGKETQQRDSSTGPKSEPLPSKEECFASEQSQTRNSSTVPDPASLESSNSTVFPGKGSVFPTEQSQKRDTEPSEEPKEGNQDNPPLYPPVPGGKVAKRKRARRSAEEPPEFAEVRQLHPSRSGSQRWGEAARAYTQRRTEGHTHEVIVAGERRYRDWCVATGIVGTDRVQQAATFLGTNKGFLEPWLIPAPTPVKQLSPIERVRAANGVNRDERVVAEHQPGQGWDSLGDDDRDLRHSVSPGFRRIGT